MTATANTERLRTKPFRVTSRKARDHQNDTNNHDTHTKHKKAYDGSAENSSQRTITIDQQRG